VISVKCVSEFENGLESLGLSELPFSSLFLSDNECLLYFELKGILVIFHLYLV